MRKPQNIAAKNDELLHVLLAHIKFSATWILQARLENYKSQY
jgi:hypothetical protein